MSRGGVELRGIAERAQAAKAEYEAALVAWRSDRDNGPVRDTLKALLAAREALKHALTEDVVVAMLDVIDAAQEREKLERRLATTEDLAGFPFPIDFDRNRIRMRGALAVWESMQEKQT